MKSVVVIGAGLAGLAAAVKLCDQGHSVTLLERGARPGGRVRRLVPGDRCQGIDLGQHLMLGCYRETISLCKRLGTARSLQRVNGVTPFVSAGGRLHPYRLGRLPAPLHALPGLLGLTQLDLRERLGLARVVAAAKWSVRADPGGLDMRDVHSWLVACGQSDRAVAGFWEPLVLATLNTPIREASALMLATVLDKGFFNRRSDAVPILPRGTLHDLLVAPAVAAIESTGGRLLCGRKVVGLSTGPGGKIDAVETSTGESFSADSFVLAVPAWDMPSIAGQPGQLASIGRRAKALSWSPIVCVELWFDRPWLRYPYAACLGSRLQWVFNHRDSPDGQRVSAVISNAVRSIELDSNRLVEQSLAEIGDFFPESRTARLEDSLVVRVARATVRAGSGQDSLRPGTSTRFDNLFLAGDWTATGLPSTIESAVISGKLAARAVGRY